MTTVRFAKDMNNECQYELLLAGYSKEWSGFVHSYKVRKGKINCVNIWLVGL